MKNGENTIKTLFQEGVFYQIPEYQRSYSWERPQLTDLLEDIKVHKEGRNYFLGTLLLQQKLENAELNKYDVVDGQQRITSITILIAAISESFAKTDPKLSDRLRKTYLKEYGTPKLKAMNEDDDFFQSYILDRGNGKDYIKTPSQKRLHKAKIFYKEEIENLSPEEVKSTLRKIEDQTLLLVYSVQDTAEATLIFETTNDRGKGLTNLEKTKSFLMYKCYIASPKASNPETILNNIRQRFSEIYREHDAYEKVITEDAALQYHFIGHLDWKKKQYQNHLKITKGKINDLIKEKDKNKDSQAIEFIDRHSKSLKESFQTIGQILCSETKSTNNLRVLARMGNFWPLLIKAHKLDQSENKADFTKTAKLLEIFAFRVYAVNKNRSHTGQSALFNLAKDFEGNFPSLWSSIMEKVRQYCPDHIFENRLRDPQIYHQMAPKDLTYMLWKYENHLRTNVQPKSAPMASEEYLTNTGKFKMTIEHIASQSPKKNIVGDEKIIPNMTPEFEENYLHSLGNLALDPKSANSSKGNSVFDDKNQKYFKKSHLKSQNELSGFVTEGKWSEKSIEHRAEKIIEFCLARWPAHH